MVQGWRRWKLVAERAAYFGLVELGVAFREAARRLGVDYRLTKRWRAAPPVVEPASVPRNQQPDGYRPHAAHQLAAARREVATWLRTGRVQCRPHHRPGERRPRMATPMVMIGERPAEATDRAVPGHWEGDLIIGKNHQFAIGTLVQRATRFVMLLHLPDGYSPAAVRDALVTKIQILPEQPRRSLTWDQGSKMHFHGQFTDATQMPVYFCDPHSPWQRGFNKNTNGLLRQYFPKGTDLSVHSAQHLDTVAAEPNDRPRTTLNRDTPAEQMTTLLAN